MFTTDTIVYPYERNQNRYENGLPLWRQQIYVPEIRLVWWVTIRDLCERSFRWISWVVV